MKSNFSKGLLLTALITGSVIWGDTNVFAEELQEYTLDQMVVTATRTEKRDVEVPASTEILTHDKILASGATNAMQSIASRYNGRLSDIRLGRVLSVPTTIKNKTWQ